MMKAIQFQFNGNHSVVHVNKPVPKNDEILVKVKYTALDTAFQACINKEMMGYFVRALKDPLYLGYHYAGTVEDVGSDVHDMAQGTGVFGFLQYEPSQKQGALSEYIVVKRVDCAVKPPNVSFDVAAASTTESITALQAIRNLGALQSGSTILIVGGAGGVGSAAIQIAKNLGGHVTAVCSHADVTQVKHWGADIVIDRSTNPSYVEELIHKGTRFDVIFDCPNSLPSKATKLLAMKKGMEQGGIVVNTIPTMTFMWNKVKLMFSSRNAYFVECHSNEKDLKLVGKWLEEGNLKIPISSTHKISNIAAAALQQKGRKNGRVVIKVEDGWK